MKKLRVLIACEYSGTVRDAFLKLGHDAISCDLLPTDVPGPHYQGDVFDIIGQGWDLMIAHPPCTYLSTAGAGWFNEERYGDKARERKRLRVLGLEFLRKLYDAPIGKVAVENPVGFVSTMWRKPDQIIQPWHYGDEATKATCLWLKGLPKLTPTKIVGRGEFKTSKSGKRGAAWNWWLPPGPDRWKIRSKTFQGIADAMATQWSEYLCPI